MFFLSSLRHGPSTLSFPSSSSLVFHISSKLYATRAWEGWSEPTTTNAPVQDEAIQTILGMNENTSSSPAQELFSPLLYPKFFRSYLSPPSSSLTSFPAHSIYKVQESSRA
jgi:hypothetical protein